MDQTRPLAMITGASSGIGAAFARALAERGYDLVLVARRRDALACVAQQVAPARSEIMEADLTSEADLARVEQRLAALPAISLLVNNAGFGTLGMFTAAKLEAQDRMHRLHVLATLRLSHAALRQMTAANRGAIINVSSVAGFSVSPGNVSYCATKAWMNNFTEGLALELAVTKSAVRVQALCPGFTVTEFHDTMGVKRAQIPGPLWMKAADVVADSLAGLEKGKVFVIPGWKYRFFVSAMKVFPRSLQKALAVRSGRKWRRV